MFYLVLCYRYPGHRCTTSSSTENFNVNPATNMWYLLFILSTTAAAKVVPRQYFSFGNYFSTGPTLSGTYIIEATTTLVLPNLQSPRNGNLGLWPGMGMDDGDLVQGLAISTVGIG